MATTVDPHIADLEERLARSEREVAAYREELHGRSALARQMTGAAVGAAATAEQAIGRLMAYKAVADAAIAYRRADLAWRAAAKVNAPDRAQLRDRATLLLDDLRAAADALIGRPTA